MKYSQEPGDRWPMATQDTAAIYGCDCGTTVFFEGHDGYQIYLSSNHGEHEEGCSKELTKKKDLLKMAIQAKTDLAKAMC